MSCQTLPVQYHFQDSSFFSPNGFWVMRIDFNIFLKTFSLFTYLIIFKFNCQSQSWQITTLEMPFILINTVFNLQHLQINILVRGRWMMLAALPTMHSMHVHTHTCTHTNAHTHVYLPQNCYTLFFFMPQATGYIKVRIKILCNLIIS